MVLGIDIGLKGGIASLDHAELMPVTQLLTKPAITVFEKDSKGNKLYYKTGPNKGEPKRRIKTPAKYATELDLGLIFKYFNDADTVVFEQPGTSIGNAARSTASTNRNFGKLLACAELAGCKIITVPPHKWKKDLGLSKDKLESVVLAENISKLLFRTSRGALLDGPAEAYLILHWYLNYYKE